MGFFRRKKTNEDQEEKEVKVQTREKKKKELQKPWEKKERILVLFVFLLTVLSSSFLALSAREWKLPGLPRMNFDFSSLSLFKEETITIEGNREKVDRIKKSYEAISEFSNLTRDVSGVYGLYVLDLEGGSEFFNYGVNENEIFKAASLIKLPVMLAMFEEEEKGRIDLETKYYLKDSDKVGGAGSLYYKPPGYEVSYRDLVKLMGKESDNTAYNISLKILGEKKINDFMSKVGMEKTNIAENKTTPREMGNLFRYLWFDMKDEMRKMELLDFLTDTSFEQWITSGVPYGVRVSHKYGRETHTVNDAGIIFTEKPFVLVIMSKGVVEREADRIIPEITKVIYGIKTR